MDIKITSRKLRGNLRVPPSKSSSHRAIIGAGLAQGRSRIDNLIFSEDIRATLKGMEALGSKYKIRSQDRSGLGRIEIEGRGGVELSEDIIDANESGSTLRFLIPLAALASEKMSFIGGAKLGERPLDPYYEIFHQEGLKYENTGGKLPLTIYGGLKSGEFSLAGNISSQFITGLLFALPLVEGDSRIILTTELESKGYVDMTIETLKDFGVEIENRNYEEFFIRGDQEYKNRDYFVEGDYSQAAFFIVAAILGGDISLCGLREDSLQGDRAIIDIVKRMGGDIQLGEKLRARKSETRGIEIDASQCPDLVPILATLGALSQGTTRIVNAGRLRIKESDRLKAMAVELNKIGGDVRELEDGLEIRGKKFLRGGTVDTWNDHRIAMALAIASIGCQEGLIIRNSTVVNKSYPGFWEDFQRLGGKIDEWNMG